MKEFNEQIIESLKNDIALLREMLEEAQNEIQDAYLYHRIQDVLEETRL